VKKTPQHRFFLPKINARSRRNIMLPNYSKWTLAILGDYSTWVFLGLDFTWFFPV